MSLPAFPHFFQFHSLRMVPCCHFCFHAREMAFLDLYVLSFLLWATPWRHPLFSLLISMLFSSLSEASFLSQILFIYSQSLGQIEPFCKGRKCVPILPFSTKPWSWKCTLLLHKAMNPTLSFIKTCEAEGQHKKKITCVYVAKLSVPVPQEQICWNVFKKFYLLHAKRRLFMLNKLEKLLTNTSSIWKCDPCTAAKRRETCGVVPSKWWSHELEKLRYRSLAATVFPKMWKYNRENTKQHSVFPAKSASFGHSHGPRTKRCRRDQNNIFKQSELPLPPLGN